MKGVEGIRNRSGIVLLVNFVDLLREEEEELVGTACAPFWTFENDSWEGKREESGGLGE